MQTATRAVKATVEPQEVTRYEAYDSKHGAKYAAAGGGGDAMTEDDEDDGWGV